ncbi:MAG: ADP-ribosylglycohydrolase family protein [Planctomycetota bacterium]
MTGLDVQGLIDDRKRGCLYGLAIGDALGATVEHRRPGSFPAVRGDAASQPASGEWTDDTAMAIALADSLASHDWDIHDQMQRYLDWWRNGKYALHGKCEKISNTMSSALFHFEQHGDATAAGEHANSPESNGSIARLAPVAIRFCGPPLDFETLAQYGAASSRPTHASEQCLSACRYFACILAGLLTGESRDDILSPEWPPTARLLNDHEFHPAVATVALGSFRTLRPPEIQASYYSGKCLEAALWAFHQADSFLGAVASAVNLGHDANTAGAVCGQLAGAYWGFQGIPNQSIDCLMGKELLEYAISGLV